ncbi:MAG: 23S rRNA (guanosine(2251)-2'-O)-methyltransferase RlmB [Pseudomonadota bacterium]
MARATHYQTGFHNVLAVLQTAAQRVKKIILQQGREDKRVQTIIKLAKKHGIAIEIWHKKKMDQQLNHEAHQGVVALCLSKPIGSEKDLQQLLKTIDEPPFLLILDSIQDPHNLAACLRSADAAGIHAIIIPKDNAVGLTATVSKAACGAAETVPLIQVNNLAQTMKWLKAEGIWLYGGTAEAEQSLYQCQLDGPLALILGSEGKGLRRLVKEYCDVLWSIPMSGTVSSLNVSIATAISVFEAVRQRKLGGI